jgi:hypothetical protein
MYEELLNPTLYKNASQTFIEDVLTTNAGKEIARQLNTSILANDNVFSYLEMAQERARRQFERSALVFPTITVWHREKWLRAVFQYPQTLAGVKKLIALSKCLAYCSFSPFVFFSSIFPADDENNRFGVSTIGTTIAGNSLLFIDNPQNIDGKIQFKHITSDIVRKDQTRTAFGKIYDLHSPQEIDRIIKCVPKICNKLKCSKEQCAANFSATLSSLERFNYEK